MGERKFERLDPLQRENEVPFEDWKLAPRIVRKATPEESERLKRLVGTDSQLPLGCGWERKE